MELEKAKSKRIDLVNKVIHLKDNIELRHGDKIINRDGNVLHVDFSGEKPYSKYVDDDGDEHRYGEIDVYYIDDYSKLEVSIEELDRDVFDIISGKKSIDGFKIKEPGDSNENSTQLVHLKSSDSLIKAQKELEIQRNYVKALHNRLHGILERKRRNLLAVIEEFNIKLEKIYKVLYTIELYLGVHEEVYQLTQGQKASADEPICMRQQLLFMDEEIGIYENGGLSFEDIQKFDIWISDNFKKIIPEQKCVVAFRVRREKKDYGNMWSNANNQPEDMKTYFLIRNGDNLYRIWTNIKVHPRLFPLRDEINKIYKEISEKEYSSKHDQKNADDLVMQYQRNSLVLQGIIDRTDIFTPIPDGINIFNPDSYGNSIRLIYDEENVLTDGRLTFKEWQKEINSKIERGSRVVYHHDWSEMRQEYAKYRFFGWREHYPNSPKDCIFTVEDVVDNDKKYDSSFFKKVIKVLFFEDSWTLDDRKRRTAFKLFFGDWFILNYDKISLEDLDFYIHSRVDRSNYLEMLPVLIKTKKIRLEELGWEKEFVRMTVEELAREGVKKEEKDVWETVEWWKTKVIWKRPITKDDAKALRMIKSKLKR